MKIKDVIWNLSIAFAINTLFLLLYWVISPIFSYGIFIPNIWGFLFFPLLSVIITLLVYYSKRVSILIALWAGLLVLIFISIFFIKVLYDYGFTVANATQFARVYIRWGTPLTLICGFLIAEAIGGAYGDLLRQQREKIKLMNKPNSFLASPLFSLVVSVIIFLLLITFTIQIRLYLPSLTLVSLILLFSFIIFRFIDYLFLKRWLIILTMVIGLSFVYFINISIY